MITFMVKGGLLLTFRFPKLPESRQRNEGVGHRVDGIQNTGDVVGLAGFGAANGVGALNPRRPTEKKSKRHFHRIQKITSVHDL